MGTADRALRIAVAISAGGAGLRSAAGMRAVSGRPVLARRGAVLCERAASTPLDLDFLYAAPLLFALSAIVLVAVSAASAPPSLQQVGALLWTPACCRCCC